MRRWMIAVALPIVIIGTGTNIIADPNQPLPSQDTGSYIVQASNLEHARDAVIDAGGLITHELGIINAVGAELTGKQLAIVRATEDVRRVYEDRALSTSVLGPTLTSAATGSCSLSAEERLRFDDDDIFWTVTNTSGVTLHLERMMVLWPKRGGSLREIEWNSKNVFAGKVKGPTASFDAQQLANVSNDDDSDREELPDGLAIGIGQSLEVEVEFDRTVRDESSYELRLFFEEGCSVDFPVAAQTKFQGDSDTAAKRTYVASLIGADALHWQGLTGKGVGVAIVDTGIWTNEKQARYLLIDSRGNSRIAAHYDAIANTLKAGAIHSDKNGHGSHVASVIASSRYKDSEFNGIAPDAELVIVKAFDTDGRGTYLDVIRGLDWVLTYKDKLGIRVLNLSFSAAPQSYYWDDPLNQAVMAAWQNGIVVVASAGNSGPEPMTVGVPGNIPYVITVGAMTDSVTPLDWSDDTLASFSSTGPTHEAFIKPDVVAPGGHVRGMMGKASKFAEKHPHYHDGDSYFTMSGTSQSAAVVSGAVALLLQAEPWLLPDQVKCKLVSTARAATAAGGDLAYSVFQQGAGMIDIDGALQGSSYSCANLGLDVTADLVGKAHFQGQALQDETGAYYLGNADGYRWDGNTDFNSGYAWGGGLPWNDVRAWNDGLPWNDTHILNDGLPWNDVHLLNDGLPWNDLHKQSITINTWVKQE